MGLPRTLAFAALRPRLFFQPSAVPSLQLYGRRLSYEVEKQTHESLNRKLYEMALQSQEERAMCRREKLWADPFYSEFPHFYTHINNPNSSMAYGCTIGPGWMPLIHQLCVELKDIDAGVAFDQIKEKYGSLRIYYHFTPTLAGREMSESQRKKIDSLIEETMEKADKSCEECGEPGELRTTDRGWYYTSCDKHDQSLK